MRKILTGLCALGLLAAVAAPALADGSARDVQAALDSYLAHDTADVALVGGPGSAGYDNGFWIRGGDFLLRANVTLQARFEAMDYDETQPPEIGGGNMIVGGLGQILQVPQDFGGDLSGFSLPRATLKLSGEAPCNIRWYMELEFGHFGRDALEARAERHGRGGREAPPRRALRALRVDSAGDGRAPDGRRPPRARRQRPAGGRWPTWSTTS